jgi:hypothetical protein
VIEFGCKSGRIHGFNLQNSKTEFFRYKNAEMLVSPGKLANAMP